MSKFTKNVKIHNMTWQYEETSSFPNILQL